MVDHAKALETAINDEWQHDGIDNLQEAYIDLRNKILALTKQIPIHGADVRGLKVYHELIEILHQGD